MAGDHDKDRVLGHGDEADGIEEYDNALPAWWLGIFYASILGGVGYGLDYHFLRPRSEASLYEQEIADAAVRWPAPEAPAVVATSDDAVSAGQAIYASTCAGCHGPELQGLIGPNLTDATWIRGTGKPEDVVEIVTNGSPAKGMPTWGPVLGQDKVSQVVAFVLSRQKSGT